MNIVSSRQAPDEEADIEQVARDWARRLAEEPDLHDDQEFVAWRDRDPRHDLAFWDAWRAWQAVGQIGSQDESWRIEAAAMMDGSNVHSMWSFRSKALRFAVPAALAASVAALLVVPTMTTAPTMTLVTPVGQNRTVALADGSHVTVGAKSGIKAFITDDERRIELSEGQAFFEVARDESRPFVVVAGDAEIRVTGTKFDVRRVDDDVQVAVLEGRVEVRRRGLISILNSNEPNRVLTAGLMSTLQEGDGFSPSVPARTTPGGWRSGRLFYDDVPLGDILEDAERYSGVRLRPANERVASMRLTASVRPGEINDMVENIEAATRLVAARSADGSITFNEAR